jgi:methionyl-tRNA formyltransferase
MKVIFMGTPDFALPSFKQILESKHHEIVAAFTQKAKPKGRGMQIDSSPVQKIAEDNGIKVYWPTSLRSPESYDLINSIEADVIVVVAYGFIVPQNIIDLKKHGCLNIHPSKLPKYRGAAPLQRTIINGDRETSVCIMQMDSGLDTGDIILQQDVLLNENISLPQLHDMCSDIGGKLLITVLDNIDSLPRFKQSKEGTVYAHKLTKEEALINWCDDAFKIDCQIRGMNPWPGAYFCYEGKNIKILEAKYINKTHTSQPGELMNNNFEVACGSGILLVKTLQPSGKQRMNAKDFLRGIHITQEKIIFS